MAYYTVAYSDRSKQEDIARFEAKVAEGLVPGKDHHNPIYAAMIWNLDRNVGRMLDKLEELASPARRLSFSRPTTADCSRPSGKTNR